MNTIIIEKRGRGKTRDIIQLCHKMNSESSYNNTVILVNDNRRAHYLMHLAQAIGCGDIPMPVTIDEIMGSNGKLVKHHYTKVLIDDVDAVLQSLLFPLYVEGISISYPKEDH